MDKKRFFSALIMAVVLSVGTYTGLSYFKPYKPEEPKLAANPSVEEIFGGTMNPADPAADAAPAEAAPADAATAPVEAAPADAATAPVEAAAAGTAPVETAAIDLASLADENPLQDDAATAASVDAAPAETPAPAAAEPEVAVTAPQTEPTSVESAPEAAPAEAPAAPKPKPAVKRYTGSREAAAPEVATKAWWDGSGDAGSLALTYAGAASYKKAIALLFNGTFESADSVNQNVVVKNASGKVVSGNWEISAANKRLLVLDVSKTGTYTVTVKSGLTDQSGKSLANTVSGPVNVY